MTSSINNPLMLPDWTVSAIDDTDPKRFVIYASYDVIPAQCIKCGSTKEPSGHGRPVFDFTDSPAYGRFVTVRTTVRRFKCVEEGCGETFMQPLPHMRDGRRMTERCADYLKRGLDGTYARLAREVDVNEKTVRQICNEAIEEMLKDHKPGAPVVLGLDELRLGGDFRVIFTDVGERKVIDLLEHRSEDTVVAWLHNKLVDRERIRIVTTDMYEPYKTAVYGVMPHVILIADKFHVQRMVNKRLDLIRARDRKQRGDKKNPRRGRYLFQKSADKLSVKARFALDGIIANNPLLRDAWTTKESFYKIWEAKTRLEAEARFADWKVSIPKSVEAEMRSVATEIDQWYEEVFVYFEHQYTAAYTESANGLIKQINRAGRGYRFDAIRARAITIPRRSPKTYAVCEKCLESYRTDEAAPPELRTIFVANKAFTALRPNILCGDCQKAFGKMIAGATILTPKPITRETMENSLEILEARCTDPHTVSRFRTLVEATPKSG